MMDLLMNQHGMNMNVCYVSFLLYYLASTSFYCYLLATTTECYDCTTTSKYDMFQTEIFQFTSFIHFVWKHTQIKRIDSYYTNNSVFL